METHILASLLNILAGFIEYWSCEDYKHPAAAVKFTMKMDTDLFALAKAKTSARSLEVQLLVFTAFSDSVHDSAEKLS
jgi:hypothetical protein